MWWYERRRVMALSSPIFIWKESTCHTERGKKIFLPNFFLWSSWLWGVQTYFLWRLPKQMIIEKFYFHHTITCFFRAYPKAISDRISSNFLHPLCAYSIVFFFLLCSVCFSNQSSLGNNVQTQKEKVLLLLCCFSIDWQHNSIMIFSSSMLLLQVHYFQILNCWSYPSPCRYDCWA